MYVCENVGRYHAVSCTSVRSIQRLPEPERSHYLFSRNVIHGGSQVVVFAGEL